MQRDEADLADAVARVCADEAGIRARLERAGESSALDRFIEAVRGDGERRERLDELHTALQRSGDALGVYAPLRNPGVVPLGMGELRQVEVVFLCPRGECSRTWRPEPSTRSEPPRCVLHDEPLRWERL